MLWLILRKLKSQDRDVRKEAIAELAKSRDPRAFDAIVLSLKDEDWDVRKRAVEALGEIGEVHVVEPLLEALKDEDSRVQETAIKALANFLDERAVEPLVAVVKQSNGSSARTLAAESLGKIRDTRAVEPLIAAFRDASDVRDAAVEALSRIGRAAVEPLIAALKHHNWEVRENAVKALGRIRDARVVEPLIAALKDKDESVRRAAIEPMGKIRDARAVKPLIELMERGDTMEAVMAASALCDIGQAAVAPLVIAMKASSFKGRQGAAKALRMMGWQPTNGDQRAWYLVGLGEFDQAVALGSVVIPPLTATVNDGDREAVRRAAGALAELHDPRAACLLIDRLNRKGETEIGGFPGSRLEYTPDAEYLIKHLLILLKANAVSIAEDDLNAIANLGEVRIVLANECGNYDTQAVDCSHLRQLARQELLRRERGEPAPSPAAKPTTILVKCECGAQMDVDAKYAGRSGKCRMCGRIVVVPAQ